MFGSHSAPATNQITILSQPGTFLRQEILRTIHQILRIPVLLLLLLISIKNSDSAARIRTLLGAELNKYWESGSLQDFLYNQVSCDSGDSYESLVRCLLNFDQRQCLPERVIS